MAIMRLDGPGTSLNIRKLLKEHDISVEQVRRELNLASTQAVYAWMDPARKNLPTLENCVALACLLEITVDEILVKTVRDYN